jgi:hypothetical protein
MKSSRLLLAAFGAALVVSGCSKIKDTAGGKMPGGGLPSGKVDPNECKGLDASDAGKKLKAFLAATQEVEKVTTEASVTIKAGCVDMGKGLGLAEGDLGGETNDVCAKVISTIQGNLKVGLKAGAKLKVVAEPAVCKADLDMQAKAAAECEGKADVGPGGSNASSQCRASGSIKVAAELKCEPPKFSVEVDAKLVADKPKIDATISALKVGMPKILEIKGHIGPIKEAVAQWVVSVKELKDAGAKATEAFKDQAICVGGQIAAAADMVGHVEANVSVSVSVSASASGSVGG